MNKKSVMLNKILVIGILILLIVAVIVPSISGYKQKTNIQTFSNNPTSFPLNDFINSYWKFDECSGDTVGDSSVHNYDGTRYGATWTTDGYSGCALVFDGVDDYVDLTSYAADIMFNKTDDLILSFYFKSTGKGIIFSATAPWGNNPEFKIELASNGKLLFYKITQLCGIILYSNRTYNDGEWHHAEYYYNGIFSNPSLILYVDDKFDSNITHFICEIENDDYAKAMMGMHVHSSTDYYNGYIDEFKIIKYEQGNEQEPPIISGPKYGEPNVQYEYTFVTNDPEGDELLSIKIDWGNGDSDELLGPFESGEELKVRYSWTEEGKYCIRAKSMDIWDESRWSDCYYVTIGNKPPEPPIIDGPPNGKPGIGYEYTFTSTDPDGDPIMYFIDWGDNNTEWTEYSDSGVEIKLKHTWDEDGDYTIKAKAKDINDLESNWSEFEVTIPRNRVSYSSLFYWFLNRFSMLERLIYLLR